MSYILSLREASSSWGICARRATALSALQAATLRSSAAPEFRNVESLLVNLLDHLRHRVDRRLRLIKLNVVSAPVGKELLAVR